MPLLLRKTFRPPAANPTLWLLVSALVVSSSGCGNGKAPAVAKTPAAEKSIPTEPNGEPEKRTVTTAAFAQIAPGSGADFTYQNGQEAGHFSIVEELGGGAALFDFNRDGLMDLLVPGGGAIGPKPRLSGHPPGLFENLGNWRFRNVTDQAGLGTPTFYSHGAHVADYDNDGFPDVVMTGYGGLSLYRNQGDGTFEECAGESGLTDRLWSSSAAWGDINGDGCLDLYVVHYVNWSWENHPFCKGLKETKREVCGPKDFEGLSDVLYFGNGDGTFRDASATVGLKPAGKGLGVVIADLDLDGRLDIYVTNDGVDNFLYQNTGDEKLKEVGLASGTARSDIGRADGSMGVDVGDFNLDGLPDLWCVNYEREAFAMYRNDGGGMLFTHASQAHGITALGGLYVGWGTVFFDFDGDEDIFVAAGHVIRYPVNSPLRQKPILLENQRGRRFVNVAKAAGPFLDTPQMGRGVAAGDIDNDGDLDLVVVRTNAPVALLANNSENDNRWVSFRLIGTRSSRDPVGAIVRIETTSGTQIRQFKCGGSYASSSDPRLFFGLGTSSIKSVTVRWPSGHTQTLDNPQRTNLTRTIVEAR